MTRSTSIYLDLVRFLAATVVFLVHANFPRLTGGLPLLSWLQMDIGNDAVMVFFVLSGLVIAYVADTKENTMQEFLLSRFARLWSVVIPALVLTVILDYAGSRIAPSLYDWEWFRTDHPMLRFGANLFFANELWFSSIRPFSNAPFWSIGYEFWYYVIFAAAYFIKRPAHLVWLGIIALVVGPRILVLLPVWLLGVYVYYRMTRNPVAPSVGWLLILGSLGGYWLYWAVGGHQYFYTLSTGLFGAQSLNSFCGWSRYFLSNYVVGILVAAHFLGISAIAPTLSRVLLPFESPIRYLASFTFSIYLFHFPMLQFFAAVTQPLESAALRSGIVVFGSIAAIWFLANITEKRKSALKRILAQAYSGFQRVFSLARAR